MALQREMDVETIAVEMEPILCLGWRGDQVVALLPKILEEFSQQFAALCHHGKPLLKFALRVHRHIFVSVVGAGDRSLAPSSAVGNCRRCDRADGSALHGAGGVAVGSVAGGLRSTGANVAGGGDRSLSRFSLQDSNQCSGDKF